MYIGACQNPVTDGEGNSYQPSFATVTVFRHGPKNPSIINTNPKTNMSPENQWLKDVFPIKIIPFKGDFR